MSTTHQAVMLGECLEGLNIHASGSYVDATFGRGGHSQAILERLGPNGRLLVIDKDLEAIETARFMQAQDPRITIQHGSFANVYNLAKLSFAGEVDGILMDLGVSSPQLDNAGRGFSFQQDGPLDMRMDKTRGLDAKTWLNQADEADIAKVLKDYGEEKFHRRIARAIVLAREIAPIERTLVLSQIIAKAHPAWEKHKNPATRSFQAIRIFINQELSDLELGLRQAFKLLAPKGRLVVMSFHSLEDRIVKNFINELQKNDPYPRDFPIEANMIQPLIKKIGKQRKAADAEIEHNVRARSAILRVAEKTVLI